MPHSIFSSGPSIFLVAGSCRMPLHCARAIMSTTFGGTPSSESALRLIASNMPQEAARAGETHCDLSISPSISTATSGPACTAILPPSQVSDATSRSGVPVCWIHSFCRLREIISPGKVERVGRPSLFGKGPRASA